MYSSISPWRKAQAPGKAGKRGITVSHASLPGNSGKKCLHPAEICDNIVTRKMNTQILVKLETSTDAAVINEQHAKISKGEGCVLFF